MARLPYVNVENAPPAVQEAMNVVPALNIFRMLGHAATAFQPYLRLGGAILGELKLEPSLRELAILQVAKQSQAEYEWVQHVAIGRCAGLTDQQITAVERGHLDEDRSLSATQRAVLGFTEQVVREPHVADATFQALSDKLDAQEIVELLLVIGTYVMLARIMTVLELEVDEPIGNAVVELSKQSHNPLRADD